MTKKSELLVGLELRCVVQLLDRAVAGEGGMALGVGHHVPRRTGPPAELAHPDVAFGGQPRDRLWPAEPAVRPRVDDLARGQAAPAASAHACAVAAARPRWKRAEIAGAPTPARASAAMASTAARGSRPSIA